MSEQIRRPTFKCFVIMPFTDTRHEIDGNVVNTSAAEWDFIYEKWIKRAVESFQPHGFTCIRSPALPGNFIKGIVKDLYESDLVIADLTGSRPNVYYELGIRHALEPGTVMITQNLDAIPSDLRSYYCFKYEYGKEAHLFESRYQAFSKQLHEKMLHFFQNTGVSDNPVSDFIGFKNAFLEERFEFEKAELIFLAETLRNLEVESYERCEDLLKIIKNPAHEPESVFIFDFVPFDAVLSRFMNTRWELLPSETLHLVFSLIQTVRMRFLPAYLDWHALRINPESFIKESFLSVVEATVNSRPQEQVAFDEVIAGLKTISLSISHHPKVPTK